MPPSFLPPPALLSPRRLCSQLLLLPPPQPRYLICLPLQNMLRKKIFKCIKRYIVIWLQRLAMLHKIMQHASPPPPPFTPWHHNRNPQHTSFRTTSAHSSLSATARASASAAALSPPAAARHAGAHPFARQSLTAGDGVVSFTKGFWVVFSRAFRSNHSVSPFACAP